MEVSCKILLKCNFIVNKFSTKSEFNHFVGLTEKFHKIYLTAPRQFSRLVMHESDLFKYIVKLSFIINSRSTLHYRLTRIDAAK